MPLSAFTEPSQRDSLFILVSLPFFFLVLAASDFSEKPSGSCVSSFLENNRVLMNHLVRSARNKSEVYPGKEGTYLFSFPPPQTGSLQGTCYLEEFALKEAELFSFPVVNC